MRRTIARQCVSCREQDARYRLTLVNAVNEVLDSADLCLDCLTSAKILDVVTPGSVHDDPDYDDAGPRTGC